MLRVLSWNVWWRFGPWWKRQRAIATVLDEADADVIGLQEVWAEHDGANQAVILADRLGYFVAQSELTYRDGLAFSNALLSRWPIVKTEIRRLPTDNGGASHRNVVHALLDTPHGEIPTFVTHLDYQFDRSATRVAQVRAIAEFVAERRTDEEDAFPPIVLGDFNAVPDADEIRMMTGRSAAPVPGLAFTDAWETAGIGAGVTWSSNNPHLDGSTWPNRRLDYVFVAWPRPRPVGNPVAARLVGTTPVGGVVPSDHYGVAVDLVTPEPTAD